MAKYALGTLAVFLISSVWLFFAWSNGNKTTSWKEIDAQLLGVEVQETIRGRPAGYLSFVSYEVTGVEYEAVVDEHLYGDEDGNTKVFIDPDDASQVVGLTGPRMQDMGRPLIATIGSGLFAIVLLLIAFSPKED